MTLTNAWSFGRNAASPDETVNAINEACRRRGGIYQQYSCKYVTWDDSSRGDSSGGLSCRGPNITDTYLKAKDNSRLFTVRPDNWNEKLGNLSASEIAVIAGKKNGPPSPITLGDLLRNIGQYGSYAGMSEASNLASVSLDANVSIRFQTTFLPVGNSTSPFSKENIEFATEAYNYQTRSDSNPKNLILLCTTQGVAVQQDGAKATKLYHHRVDSNGMVHRHWLEAERTHHAVGSAQKETEAEKADAVQRGKAVAAVIGPRALGTRFNVLMTVQVPLKQQTFSGSASFGPPPPPGFSGGFLSGPSAPCGAPPSSGFSGGFLSGPSAPRGSPAAFGSMSAACAAPPPAFGSCAASSPLESCPIPGGFFGSSSLRRPVITGTSNAARVSIGTEHDVWNGLTIKNPKRHEKERVTVTVVLYNVVVGGVPSESDVVAAIDDLEKLYSACASVFRKDAPVFNAASSGVTFPPSTPSSQQAPMTIVNGDAFPEPQCPVPASLFAKKFSPFDGLSFVSLEEARSLPVSDESFHYLHNRGLALLNDQTASQGKIWAALGFFRLANELHTQLKGLPSEYALYNASCCCSRLAQKAAGAPSSPAPPETLPAWAYSADKCLDAGASWLLASVGAGFTDYAQMAADSDLASLRILRMPQYETAQQLAHHLRK